MYNAHSGWAVGSSSAIYTVYRLRKHEEEHTCQLSGSVHDHNNFDQVIGAPIENINCVSFKMHCFKTMLINTWNNPYKTSVVQHFPTLHGFTQPYKHSIHMCTVGFVLACSAELKEEIHCDWSIETWPNKEVFSNAAQSYYQCTPTLI